MTTSSNTPEPGTLLDGRLLRRTAPCREHFKLTFELEGFPEALPGQFVQIRCSSSYLLDSRHAERLLQDGACDDSQRMPTRSSNDGASEAIVSPGSKNLGHPIDSGNAARAACVPLTATQSHAGVHSHSGVLLRRPFSIGGLRRDGSRCELDVIGRIVGKGTTWLNALSEGDVVNILGPLGRPFSFPCNVKRALLVAGGAGFPPIRWLGETLRAQGIMCEAILGARTVDLLPVVMRGKPSVSGAPTSCVEEFAQEGIDTTITTDDGSCGLHGTVTDALERAIERLGDVSSVCVYACGPEGMLRAIAELSAKHRVARCEVAMERMMGCGMGVCQSCVVKVKDKVKDNTSESPDSPWRYALCCSEGPVFDASEIIWV